MSAKQLKKDDLRGFTLTKSKTYENEGNYLAWVNIFYGDRLTYDTNRKIPMLDGNEVNAIVLNDLLKEAAETRTVKDELGDWKTLGFAKINRMRKAVIEVAKMHEVDTTDRIRDEIIKEYGDQLAFNPVSNVILVSPDKDEKDEEKKRYLPNKFFVDNVIEETRNKYSIKKGVAKMLVEEVARMKMFKNAIIAENMGLNEEGINAENWEDYLDKEINENGEGKPKQTIRNFAIFFLFSPKYHNRLKNNLFKREKIFIDNDGKNKGVYEETVSEMKLDIQDYFGGYKDKMVEDAINVALKRRSFNPVIEMFEEYEKTECEDGLEYAETFFTEFLAADDTPLTRKITVMMMLGCILRVFEEGEFSGYPFDYMCILDGPQGIGKSKTIERMFGAEYTETKLKIEDEQDCVIKLNGALVGVFDELSAFSKAQLEEVKDFITKTGNKVRLPYERRARVFPRHTVFFGTTNKEFYLRDYATDYERRFAIIECHGEGHDPEWWDEHLTDERIAKAWAQIMRLYRSGKENYKKYTYFSKEEIEELKKIQLRKKTFNENDVLKEKIRELLYRKYPTAYCTKEEWFSSFDTWKGVVGTSEMNEIPCVWIAEKLGKPTSYIKVIIAGCYPDWEYAKHGRSKMYNGTCVYRRKEPIAITDPKQVVPNEAVKAAPYAINFRKKSEVNSVF